MVYEFVRDQKGRHLALSCREMMEVMVGYTGKHAQDKAKCGPFRSKSDAQTIPTIVRNYCEKLKKYSLSRQIWPNLPPQPVNSARF